MRTWMMWILGVMTLVGIAFGGYWYSQRVASESSAEGDGGPHRPTAAVEPVATVTVVPIRQSSIAEMMTAYGTVVSELGEVRVVSVAYEVRVIGVLVTPGQEVAAGTPLIDVQASPATLLQLREARNAAAAARESLEQIRQLYQQHLVTNQELYTAQNALRSAEATLQSLQNSGAGKVRQLKTDAPGVVSKVDVQVGQIVPTGNPLVEVAARNRIEVKLGVEPEDVPYLHAGQTVRLTAVHASAPRAIEGQIRLITGQVDPTTRLVEVFVLLPQPSNLMLEEFVRGQLVKASTHGLVVPREAVLPEEGHYTLYTVKDDHASKHVVEVGLENDQAVQVTADDLKPGDLAVIIGNYELQDGMAVQVLHPGPGTLPGAGTTSGAPASSSTEASQ
jgi:membrane fusion protein, multidrug efflux system